MGRFLAALLAGALALAAPPAARPQSLADLAEREKERRTGEAVPSYGDEALSGDERGERGTFNMEAAAGAEDGERASPVPSRWSDASRAGWARVDESLRRRREEHSWRARADAARRRIDASDRRVQATRDHLNRDVLRLMASCDGRQIDRRAHIQNLADELEEAEAAAEEAREGLVELRRQARREFVPPGWLREK